MLNLVLRSTALQAPIDKGTPEDQLVFSTFAALAEFKRVVISEHIKVGLASAQARGRSGGAQYEMVPAKMHLVMAAMRQEETVVSDLYEELGDMRLFRYLGSGGVLH